MNPQKKAEELRDKFYFQCEFNCQPSTVKGMSIKMALIAVNEILENIEATTLYIKDSIALHNKSRYWNEVKEHLTNLN